MKEVNLIFNLIKSVIIDYISLIKWEINRLKWILKVSYCAWFTISKEEMKKNKRLLDRAARKIERERGKVEGQEAKQLKEI